MAASIKSGKFGGVERDMIIVIIIVIVVLVAGALFGGCVAFQPQNDITIVNNTPNLLNIETGSYVLVRDLAPGESFSMDRWCFYDGEWFVLIAKSYNLAGKYLGAGSRTYNMTSGYYNYSRRQAVWIVERGHIKAP